MNEDGMTMVFRRRQAAEDQVRVAYGAVPVILAGFSADDPVRTAIRERARSLLVESGYLTAEELGTLSVKDAIAVALRRVRREIERPDPVRAPAFQPRRRSAGVADPAV